MSNVLFSTVLTIIYQLQLQAMAEEVEAMTLEYSRLGLSQGFSCATSQKNGMNNSSNNHPNQCAGPSANTNYANTTYENEIVSIPTTINYTVWPLYLASIYPRNSPTSSEIGTKPYGVFSHCYIPENTYIGPFEADKMYTWEIPEENYDRVLWVMEDCVLYFPEYPYDILSYVREGFYKGLTTNCIIHIETDKEGVTQVGLMTTKPIYENQELIYWHPGLV